MGNFYSDIFVIVGSWKIGHTVLQCIWKTVLIKIL